MLVRVKTKNNPNLNDEEFVVEVMDRLIKDYPAVKGYLWERKADYINLLIYGDIDIAKENGIRWSIE